MVLEVIRRIWDVLVRSLSVASGFTCLLAALSF